MTHSPVKSTRGLALIVASCAVAAGMLSATSPALATPDVNDGSVAAATPTPDPPQPPHRPQSKPLSPQRLAVAPRSSPKQAKVQTASR